MPETDLLFEELTDPRGIRFWPEDKGRDGCRTPIPWDAGEAPNGFTTGKPWLPLKPELSALNVASQNADPASVLNFYRKMLAFRHEHPSLFDGEIEFLKAAEPLLVLRRSAGDDSLLCVFNLSASESSSTLKGESAILLGEGASIAKGRLKLAANGFAILGDAAQGGHIHPAGHFQRDAAVVRCGFRDAHRLAAGGGIRQVDEAVAADVEDGEFVRHGGAILGTSRCSSTPLPPH